MGPGPNEGWLLSSQSPLILFLLHRMQKYGHYSRFSAAGHFPPGVKGVSKKSYNVHLSFLQFLRPGSSTILKPGTETKTRRLESLPERNKNRISVSINSWFRQEDFVFVCSLMGGTKNLLDGGRGL